MKTELESVNFNEQKFWFSYLGATMGISISLAKVITSWILKLWAVRLDVKNLWVKSHKSIFPWKIPGRLTKKRKKKSPHRSKLWTCAGVHLNACTVGYLIANTIKFSITFLITFTLNICQLWIFFLNLNMVGARI